MVVDHGALIIALERGVGLASAVMALFSSDLHAAGFQSNVRALKADIWTYRIFAGTLVAKGAIVACAPAALYREWPGLMHLMAAILLVRIGAIMVATAQGTPNLWRSLFSTGTLVSLCIVSAVIEFCIPGVKL